MSQLYLDYHAASPVAEFSFLEMEKARSECWANPSSVHSAGREAKRWLELSRERVANSLEAKPADIVFTSGGTEACNLGIESLLKGVSNIVTTDIEHPAISEKLNECSKTQRVDVTKIKVSNGDASNIEKWEALLSKEKTLVVMQWINHETGILFPVEEISTLVCKHQGRIFLDATQALGKVNVDVAKLQVDGLAVASHKVGGPSGAGALWIKREHQVQPLFCGGAQERGRRAGSPGLESLVGFGAACLHIDERIHQTKSLSSKRDQLETELQKIGGVINGIKFDRVPTVVNVSFKGTRGAVMVAAMDIEGICVSSGSACSSGLDAPSKIIQALYPSEPWRAESCLRISFGPGLVEGWVQQTVDSLRIILNRTLK